MASPFSLTVGMSVYASIVCYNGVGDSPNSDVGNGATVIVSQVPDAPLSLARSLIISLDKTSVSYVWEDAAFDGNQPILDYRVSYDQGSDNWAISDIGITTLSFTQVGLTPGTLYGFRVEARNVVGYSAYSTPLYLVAAQEPDTPPTPTTSLHEVNNMITITWSAPSNNGSPITSY
jgi:hypothetical protein